MEYKKNNILYIFGDQLSLKALTIFGNKNLVKTPNIDFLARKGVSFINSYCSTPQCSPSRSSILTGLYPHKTEVKGNINTTGTENLNSEFITIGKHLKNFGYSTGYFGKWHLGTSTHEFGFDVVHTLDDYDGLDDVREKDIHTTERALSFIDRHNTQPWFAMVSYDNPHDIYLVNEMKKMGLELDISNIKLPENFEDNLLEKPEAQRLFRDIDQGNQVAHFNEEDWKYYIAFYYYLIEILDMEVGKLINKLKETGQYESTIILFTSDHGDLMGAHKCPFKGPMMYEELIKIPLIVSCPSILPINKIRNQATINTDVFPTICDLIGIEIPKGLDGISIKECILKEDGKGREYVIVEYYSKQDWVNPIRSIIKDDYKYNLYLDTEELYNLSEDSGEMRNLSNRAKHKELRETLKALLVQWIKKNNDPFFSYKVKEVK